VTKMDLPSQSLGIQISIPVCLGPCSTEQISRVAMNCGEPAGTTPPAREIRERPVARWFDQG
jgi:hypothetical protein